VAVGQQKMANEICARDFSRQIWAEALLVRLREGSALSGHCCSLAGRRWWLDGSLLADLAKLF